MLLLLRPRPRPTFTHLLLAGSRGSQHTPLSIVLHLALLHLDGCPRKSLRNPASVHGLMDRLVLVVFVAVFGVGVHPSCVVAAVLCCTCVEPVLSVKESALFCMLKCLQKGSALSTCCSDLKTTRRRTLDAPNGPKQTR